jgi:hypothetical protein
MSMAFWPFADFFLALPFSLLAEAGVDLIAARARRLAQFT